ncbi:MAG: GDSL-type esterase/lipase family protein, partial [Candidatus Omnitrophica bacterium]|nr:GDSL-type esterase/lipase family protein [Candidatus Omnitrophota bacterium]
MKFKKIGLVLLGVVLALLSLEIALRMAGFAFEKFAGRSAVIEKKKGLRILCLGDSYTYGLGVAREESYPAQLERLLRKEPGYDEVEVINCGKPGINTPLLAKDFRRLATRYQPDIVLLLIGVNDAWNFEGMEGAFSSWPERIRSFLSGLRIGKFFTIARERPRLQEVKNKLAAVEKMGGFNNFYCWQAILLGNECRDNNEFEQAMLYYDVALKIDPRDARIVVELVRLYRKIIENEAAKCSLDNKEKTISSLAGAESVIEKINPENRDAGKEAQGLYAELISYGNYCRKAKEFGKADMYFRLAGKIEQDDPVGNIESVRLKKELLEER